jgi:hypothetical protein
LFQILLENIVYVVIVLGVIVSIFNRMKNGEKSQPRMPDFGGGQPWMPDIGERRRQTPGAGGSAASREFGGMDETRMEPESRQPRPDASDPLTAETQAGWMSPEHAASAGTGADAVRRAEAPAPDIGSELGERSVPPRPSRASSNHARPQPETVPEAEHARHVSQEALRQAVIWAEILGPPRAKKPFGTKR